MGIKDIIKRQPRLKRTALFIMRISSPVLSVAHCGAVLKYGRFLRDWVHFRRAGGRAAILDFYPCLFDRTPSTPFDAHYFHQAVWALRHIVAAHVAEHVDIGSQSLFVGMLSAVTHVTFVDIRPMKVSLPDYRGVQGSVLDLPFADNSIPSLSCLHVVEHIGLGRYGDAIDPAGSAKAAREIVRVLMPGGRAYVSAPIGESRVQFNGQRVFAVEELLDLFGGLKTLEMIAVNGDGSLVECRNPALASIDRDISGADCGLGMFLFEKEK